MPSGSGPQAHLEGRCFRVADAVPGVRKCTTQGALEKPQATPTRELWVRACPRPAEAAAGGQIDSTGMGLGFTARPRQQPTRADAPSSGLDSITSCPVSLLCTVNAALDL